MTDPSKKRLSEEEKQWILTNYRSHSEEFGFSAMAKKFDVCRTTIKVLIRGKKRVKSKLEPQPKISIPKIDPVIYFGKHKGLKYSELPLDYLQWMKREIKSPEKTVAQVNFELNRRKANVPVKSHNSKEPWNDSSTHYEWTDRNGKVHWIPKDVCMEGKEAELAPF